MPGNHIILVGFMGAGKSTVAAELANQSGLSLVELDAEIEQKAGISIREIFEKYGEEKFRDLESSVLQELVDKDKLIISTGGGILGRPRNRELMKGLGKTVYLRAPFLTLKSRLGFSRARPLVKEQPDWVALESLFLSRAPFYEMADLIIDTDNKKPVKIATEIIQLLMEAKC